MEEQSDSKEQKNGWLRIRISDGQLEALRRIVGEIQAATPHASVSASSVAREALRKYIDGYTKRK